MNVYSMVEKNIKHRLKRRKLYKEFIRTAEQNLNFKTNKNGERNKRLKKELLKINSMKSIKI